MWEEIIAKIFQNGKKKKKKASHRFMKYCTQLLSHVQLFVTHLDWVAGSSAHGILQARILGCHFLLQGIFPTQG